ncbi:hypothetical protein ABPG72_008983 [Tetrahymena utriculariae]
MKQQVHSSSYQQLGAKKKVEKCIDYSKKQGMANQHSLLNHNQANSSQAIGHEGFQYLQHYQKNAQIISHNYLNQGINKQLQQNGISLEQMINYQNNQLHLNYLNQQNILSQIATPIVQTAQKTKKSISPSQKSGSQIKLKSAQLENIQKQFNKLLEKENKQLNSSNSNSSANKSYITQHQQQSALLTGSGSATYLNQTKSSAMQRRQRNLTQLNINSNNSLKKGNSSSLTRINRSITPNSRTNSSSLQRNKGGISTNLLLLQSGNQTTANITQKRIDFSYNDRFNNQKQNTKSSQQINPNSVQIQQQLQLQAQLQNSQQQKNSAMCSTSQQSCASFNGEVINNRLASIIEKNPQNLEEYSIKDKQLNKILQQLLQQRMKQQQQSKQQQQQMNQYPSNKNIDCSTSPTMSLMSSKPSTLQSYNTQLGLNHGKNSQFQNGNNTNSLQGYSFLNSSTKAGASMQNTNSTLSNQNIANQSNLVSSNNTNQTQLVFNQSSLSAQLQARNFENNSIFQEQLRIEEQFQQRYQQYKEKFSVYQSESQNNSKMINNTQKDSNVQQTLKSKEQGECINIVENEQTNSQQQDALNHNDIKQNTQNCDEEFKEKEENYNIYSNIQNQNDSQYNSTGHQINSNINNPKELLSPGDDLAVSNYQSSNTKQNYMTNQNNYQASNMAAPMTINTESDSVQLMSAKERENMMQYIENAQFPTGSTTYQDLIQNIPNDIHQEIILIYEQKIKEITEKFQHRDIVIRQSLMKLEKENSILLTKVQEQQEEIFRYKKLRELETKLIKKLEGEIKLEKAKYQKLFQQKFYKKGSDSKNFNNQLIDELNKKLSEMQQEKECLEYLLKDALLKTELLKAKESVIFRQIPFSNNLNTSTSTISIGGNQNISNFNQLFSHAGNSSSNGNFQIPPTQQAEYVNLLSLDNSLNKSQNYVQQQQQQQLQFQQQQQQFQQQQNQRLFTHEKDSEHSPDNNFLRVRNKSHDQQYFKQQQIPDLNMVEFRNQLLTEEYEQYHKQYPYTQQQITQNQQLKNQLNQQQAVNIEAEFQNSERSNFMTAYQNSQGDNLQNIQNGQNYPSNYFLRKHVFNQNYQQEETQGSEMRSGSYMGRSLSQNQQILPEDYYYSENEQHEDYDFQNSAQQHDSKQPRLISQDNQQENVNENHINYHITQQQQQQQQQQQKGQQKYPLYFETNNQENIQTFEFNSNMNYLINQYSGIRNSQNLHNSAQLVDIRAASNSQGICTIPISNHIQLNNGNNKNYLQINHHKNSGNNNDMLILDVNEKSGNRSYLINNSQVIHEEASSADNTTQNNDNNQNGSNFSQNNSNKMKLSSNNFDSSSAVIEVNINDTNNLNHELFQKSDNSKIFVENETLSKSDNIEHEHEHEHEDEDIEAEFKEISESNRRREQSQEKQEDINQEKMLSNRNQHEVQSLTEEYLKNKVEILNNESFNQNNINQQNTLIQSQQQTNENNTIDQNQKEEEDQAIVQYFNTKNLYLQKYYASQNNSSAGLNSKSLNSSGHTSEKNNSNNNINNINN